MWVLNDSPGTNLDTEAGQVWVCLRKLYADLKIAAINFFTEMSARPEERSRLESHPRLPVPGILPFGKTQEYSTATPQPPTSVIPPPG
jgi:hypothetical protein